MKIVFWPDRDHRVPAGFTRSFGQKMKTLIVYYSLSGNNKALADFLQQKLECDAYSIKEFRRRTRFTILLDALMHRTPRIALHDLHLREYELLLFVAPVWAGHLATPLKAFIKHNRDEFQAHALITVCGGHPGQREKIAAELHDLTGKDAETVAELALTDLPGIDKRKMIDYRLTGKDLEYFVPAIDQFIGRARGARIVSYKSQPV